MFRNYRFKKIKYQTMIWCNIWQWKRSFHFWGTALEFRGASLTCSACWQLGRWVLLLGKMTSEAVALLMPAHDFLLSRGQSAALLVPLWRVKGAQQSSVLWCHPGVSALPATCKLTQVSSTFSRWHWHRPVTFGWVGWHWRASLPLLNWAAVSAPWC